MAIDKDYCMKNNHRSIVKRLETENHKHRMRSRLNEIDRV